MGLGNVTDPPSKDAVGEVTNYTFEAPGEYEVTLNADRLTAGIYFYRVVMGNYTSVKKMVLLK